MRLKGTGDTNRAWMRDDRFIPISWLGAFSICGVGMAVQVHVRRSGGL